MAAVTSTVLTAASLASTAAGAAASSSASKKQAAASEQQSLVQQQIAHRNSELYMLRRETSLSNAKHAQFLGRFAQERAEREASINEALGQMEYKAGMGMAGLALKIGAMKKRAADMQAVAFRNAAKSVRAFADEDVSRMVEKGDKIEGAQRSAAAAAGVTESGSVVEVMAETAGELELQRLDVATKAEDEARKLEYQADVASYEGDVAEFDARVQSFTLGTRATIGKYMTQFQASQTRQAGYIRALEAKQTAENFRTEAFDNETRAELTLLEGYSASNGLIARASAQRSAARADLYGAGASVAGSAAKAYGSGTFSGRG